MLGFHVRFGGGRRGPFIFLSYIEQNKCLQRLLECVILSIITGKTVTIMAIEQVISDMIKQSRVNDN